MPIYDNTAFERAGIQLTGKQIKYLNAIDGNGVAHTGNPNDCALNYNTIYPIMQKQNMVETLERYMWTNIPFGLTADLIERILFYRGKAIFYYNEKVEKFQFLPFALNGRIDEYGRFTACNTLPFLGADDTGKKGDKKDTQRLIYQDLEIVYDLPYSMEVLEQIKSGKTFGIILNDSSLDLSQQPTIRSNYVKPVLHMMSILMQIINTAMYGAADHNLLQVTNQDELESLNYQIDAINLDITKGKRFTGVIGAMPIISLKTTNATDLEGLWNTFNSLTNFLKSITGVANPGVFDKKAHLLQEEQALNGSNADDIYYNGLRQRQEFCLMVQAYYNYPIWCQSKRGMSGAQAENMETGETSDPDNTQYNDKKGGESNGNTNSSN